MAQGSMNWKQAVAQAGCYDFLLPRARAAAEAAVSRSVPLADASFVGDEAREALAHVCLSRLRTIHEMPLVKLALQRLRAKGNLGSSLFGGSSAEDMLTVADEVRAELLACGGASLYAELPQLEAGCEVVLRNCTDALAELLERLLVQRAELSGRLLGGKPITRLLGVSGCGGDPHRHGRIVLRVATDVGAFFYKPHDCSLDALFEELAESLFQDSVRAARIVPGAGYAFVEELAPVALAGEDELAAYWRALGRATALFHALGSRDMTYDNLMCCGAVPGVLDLETLLTGEMALAGDMDLRPNLPEDAPEGDLGMSAICTAIPPLKVGAQWVSPLLVDNRAGTCLPRVDGAARTVAGFEDEFVVGFVEGYQRLLAHASEVRALLERHGSATCRQILLNTQAYTQAVGRVFSPGALADEQQRAAVLRELSSGYCAFAGPVGGAVAPHDAAALAEADIPYYCSRMDGRELFANDADGSGASLGQLLARSALEVAQARLANLGEDDLRYELALIRSCLRAASRQRAGAPGQGDS